MGQRNSSFIRLFFRAFDNVASEFLMIGPIVFVFLAVIVLARNYTTLNEYFYKINERKIPKDTSSTSIVNPIPTNTSSDETTVIRPTDLPSLWTDDEFWSALNQKRKENGVNEIKRTDALCQVTSFRLDEALGLADIDQRQELEELTDSNQSFADILLSYSSVLEVVSAWDGDLSSTISQLEENPDTQTVLSGGEFVWGCASSAHSFTVIMVAY